MSIPRFKREFAFSNWQHKIVIESAFQNEIWTEMVIAEGVRVCRSPCRAFDLAPFASCHDNSAGVRLAPVRFLPPTPFAG